MPPKSSFLIVAILLGAFVASAMGTGIPIYNPVAINGSAGFQFGNGLAGGGDWDGDGADDILVGSPSLLANTSGTVTLRSGKSGATLLSLTPPALSQYFGTSVESLGDLNGDGWTEFAVGAPNPPASLILKGNCYIYSGKDGTLLRTLTGPVIRDRFGFSISNLGDINQDGISDFVVGAPGTTGVKGAIHVYSGAHVGSGVTGVLIYNIQSPLAATDQFGYDVQGTMDLDGDQISDFFVGLPGLSTIGFSVIPGSVHLYSGTNGALLNQFSGDNVGDRFGAAIAADKNLLIVGAPSGLIGVSEQGAPIRGGYAKAYRFLSATLSHQNWSVNASAGNQNLGASVAILKQLMPASADPGRSVAIASMGAIPLAGLNEAHVDLLSENGSPLGGLTLGATASAISLADAGNTDGGVSTELALGFSPSTTGTVGFVKIFSCPAGQIQSFGTSCGTDYSGLQNQPPVLNGFGIPVVSSSTAYLNFQLVGASGFEHNFLLFGLYPASQTLPIWGGNCNLLLEPSWLLPLVIDIPYASPFIHQVDFNLPQGIPAGLKIYAQALSVNPSFGIAPGGRAASNGIEINFIDGVMAPSIY